MPRPTEVVALSPRFPQVAPSPETLRCGLELKDRVEFLERRRERVREDLAHFALFLLFSCIEMRQTATSQSKAKILEVIGKMKKTGMNG